MLSALRLTYLTCCVGHWVTESTGTGSLDDQIHTFSSTKLLTRVTVADKLVLVNPFWWNNYLFICLMRCLFAVSRWFVQRAPLTVNIDLSDVTNKYYTVLYRTVSVYEKKNRSLVLVGWFCCFTSQVNSYGHCGTVSSPNHTFSWAGLNKRLTSNSCTYFRL